MVPLDDEHEDTPEIDSNASTKERKRRRLTPMPDCLMHWWTPLAIAGILFLLSMLITSIWGTATYEEIYAAITKCPHRWPFRMRTPSREEIEVCLTITGAGLAFSAWQQRSHDNAAKEKEQKRQEQNRLEQIERDEYWKRREQIYQLLGSENPGLRLGAVALLAELADSAAHSTLLNNTEKQQLQRHIINTICLQMRREGACLESEGTEDEHQQIQTAILQALFERINEYHKDPNLADWSHCLIFMTDTQFVAPFAMTQVITHAKFILDRSTFRNRFTLFESSLKSHLHTKDTTFLSKLTILKSQISVFQLPLSITETNYTKSQISHNGIYDTINIKLTNYNQRLKLSECDFFASHCECDPSCSCKRYRSNICRCQTSLVCSCRQTCAHAKLSFSFEPLKNFGTKKESRTPELTILNCRTGTIRIAIPANQFQARLSNNTIYGQLEAQFLQLSQNSSKRTHFVAEYNRIAFTKETQPITLTNRSDASLTELCTFTDNYTFSKSGNSNQISEIQSQHISRHGNVIHFQFQHSIGDTLQMFSWDEGRFSGSNHAFLCDFHTKDGKYIIREPRSVEDYTYIQDALTAGVLQSATNGSFIELSREGVSHLCNSEHGDRLYIVTEPVQSQDSQSQNSASDQIGSISSDSSYLASFTLGTSMCINSGTFVGEWRSNNNYYIIHHFATLWGVRGIAHAIFRFAATKSPYLRCVIDETNFPMRHALEAFGFKQCGTVTFQNFKIQESDTRHSNPKLVHKLLQHMKVPIPFSRKQKEELNNAHTIPKLIAYDWINESELRE